MTWLLSALAVLLCAGSLAGFAGEWHWALDLLSHFRPHYAASLALALVVCWWRRAHGLVVCACAGCLAVQAGTLLPFFLPAEPATAADPLRVLLANVHTRNRNFAAVADLLARENPDIVVLQETDAPWLEALAVPRARYPHRVEEARADNFGIAVWSKLPLANARTERLGSAGVPSIVADVQRAGATFTLVATHPLPPVGAVRSRLRDEGLAALARLAAAEPAPVLVAGDLNCTPWSPRFRALLRDGHLRDSAEGRGLCATWPARLGPLGIPLDHCLYGAGLCVLDRRVGPRVGSDHRPLIVDVALVRAK